jgi:hypothetical protein
VKHAAVGVALVIAWLWLVLIDRVFGRGRER